MVKTIDQNKIRSMMKAIILERRKLTKQYYDLKKKLEHVEEMGAIESENRINSMTITYRSKPIKRAFSRNAQSTKKRIPFERIAGYIVMILKEAGIPLSNKEILSQLKRTYQVELDYLNFTNNILPRVRNQKQFPVVKAHRGYCQYQKKGCDSLVR